MNHQHLNHIVGQTSSSIEVCHCTRHSILHNIQNHYRAAHIVQVFDGANKLLYEAEVPVDGCYTIRAAEPLRAHGVLDSTKRKLIIIGVAASGSMSEECLCKSSQYHYEISKDDYLEYVGAPEWNPI